MEDWPIYLDNHATTRLDPRALEAMMPWLEEDYGNPSSRSHPYGWRAEERVETAREHVARLIGASPHEIFFTSGATESNNIVIKSQRGPVFASVLEHKSVLAPCEWMRAQGVIVCHLGSDKDGFVQVPQEVAHASLVSVMLANNEVGTLQRQALSQIADRLPEGGLLHSDIAQAAGKEPVDVRALRLDLASLSAHKMYGPKGIGALYVREEIQGRIAALVHGGGQERGLRSGTLNVPAIAGFGEAALIAFSERAAEQQRVGGLRDLFAALLKRRIPGIRIHGGEPRLKGNLCVSLPCADMEAFMAHVSGKVALSFGSACMSSKASRSHVLREMGIGEGEIRRSVRFCVGRFNTEEEVRLAADHVAEALDKAGRGG